MHRLVVNVLKSVMPLLFILLCSVSIYAQQVTPTPSTEVSLAGKWASNWGPVELGSDLTGSWNQGVGIGQFTSGSYDAQTRRVEFQYYQPWNKMYGHCVMTLSADSSMISGTWAQQRAGQKTGSGGSGTWTMRRTATAEKHDPDNTSIPNNKLAGIDFHAADWKKVGDVEANDTLTINTPGDEIAVVASSDAGPFATLQFSFTLSARPENADGTMMSVIEPPEWLKSVSYSSGFTGVNFGKLVTHSYVFTATASAPLQKWIISIPPQEDTHGNYTYYMLTVYARVSP